ncbi:MAG: AAA family ATPase [Bacteroidaceae bacterium]|nr:AAA family ATPase [Bacteroidaceae bacterium]
MINDYLKEQIKENFLYEPTLEQEIAVRLLSKFFLKTGKNEVFVLRGYAGTGKTSLVGALVKTLENLKIKSVLLAPTGRAAKVFSVYAAHPAFTIHKRIYRQKKFSGEAEGFLLNDNLQRDTLFLVDEASMISNEGLSGRAFGSGRLLDDLIRFVYSGVGCRLLLMGDTAQLAPVGEEQSPALYADVLKGYNLNVSEVELTTVARQKENSGILWNATQLRQLIATDQCNALPLISIGDFTDIRSLPGNEMIDKLNDSYDHEGIDETIVICRSNKQANIYNNGIRSQVLWREDELNTGDMLMVAKNNYYWTKSYKEMDFIANGEIVLLKRIHKVYKMYDFHFADVTIAFPDLDNFEIEAKLLLDSLHSDAPAMLKDDGKRLFENVLEDYADIPLKQERMKKMKSDPYYNALQVKYAYAITCHKAQGGQWKNVFLDQGYMTDDFVSSDYFRWLYTAFTRATKMLYLVNYPPKQLK